MNQRIQVLKVVSDNATDFKKNFEKALYFLDYALSLNPDNEEFLV